MSLARYGWNDFFAEGFAPFAAEGFEAGRVFLQHNKIYMLYTERGEVEGEARGRLRHRARGREELPAVGDWVALRRLAEDETRAVIHERLPRKSKFSRKAAGTRDEEQVVAANVDTVLLVMGLDQDFNLRRLERYLVMAWESGADPVVVLNKSDLAEDARARVEEVERVAPGVHVVLLSAKHDAEGAEQLRPFVGPGRTVALLGSSGVGKSTIVNRLLGAEVQRTREVRTHDDRGRHTTTHRELFVLPEGGLVIDTPGMRELQLLASERGLRETFDDVEALTRRCRFTDCRHEGEPDCAVAEALATGALDAERYGNYQKMLAETRELAARQDLRATQEEKAKAKRIARAMRNFYKIDKRRT